MLLFPYRFGMAEQPSLLSPRSYPSVSIEAVVPPTIFFLIALCVCTFRIYVRLRHFFLGWDDWFILVGMVRMPCHVSGFP